MPSLKRTKRRMGEFVEIIFSQECFQIMLLLQVLVAAVLAATEHQTSTQRFLLKRNPSPTIVSFPLEPQQMESVPEQVGFEPQDQLEYTNESSASTEDQNAAHLLLLGGWTKTVTFRFFGPKTVIKI